MNREGIPRESLADQETLALVEPNSSLAAAFLVMVEDFEAAGEHRYHLVAPLLRIDFPAYVRRLEEVARGIGLPQGYVPQTTFWMIRNGSTIVGVSHLRHRLTPALKKEGGHIGYTISPSHRRKGYGTRLLALTLEKAGELGLRRVMVTCDSDNIGSARIIQKNGGLFAGESLSDESRKAVSRYWIDLPAGE